MDLKTIAFYLPQYYRTKENDEWWGEGFTDWVSAQNAVPLFEGHYEPHIPLNDYYYDLSQKTTMEWQAGLMRQYGIDGLCFYHYWFKDGQMTLEKPAENLLRWKDIDMPFCFSWANQTWARSWGNIREKNSWTQLLEKKQDGDSILMEQDYGTEEDWIEHFDYLIPFLKDKRYIKIDNKPLLLIHRSDLIHCLEPMLKCWREKSVDAGFDNLFIIGGGYDGNTPMVFGLDGILFGESTRKDMHLAPSKDDVVRIAYDEMWENILQKQTRVEHPFYVGVVGYDDTPRQGRNGTVIEGADPYLFRLFLSRLMAKNVASGSYLVFINAWNEWGEGMHLEPDKKFGFSFLEQIEPAKVEYQKYISFYNNRNKTCIDSDDMEKKHELYLNDLDYWMTLRERKIRFDQWFMDRGVNNIAIYGLGIMGRHLLEELKYSPVRVSYIIDQGKDNANEGIPVYNAVESLPDVDYIVIAAYYFYNQIIDKLIKKHKVVSLRDVLYSFESQ